MKPIFALALLLCAAPLQAATDYPLTEDSKAHDNVPKGEILRFVFDKSKIFPGTRRDVSVYVPKQYDGTKPACVYVNQDGVQWNAPTVFDNLIARGEMPVTIGVFVTPGVVPAVNDNALPRFNRSLEYDGLGPYYANFLLNELLPEVETKKTADGRAIVLSKNGNDRAIGGSSSGAICAFTAAWERPDAFSRVFSAIGTYVGLRGGNEYPTIIRKYEPKPLRIFLQDGSADQNIYGGDWWMANQEMERALAFAGYEVNHAWGDGGHNGAQGTMVFPDAMRWLWKDWPQPLKRGEGAPQMKEILIPGENWSEIKPIRQFDRDHLADLIVDKQGNVYSVASNSLINIESGDSRKLTDKILSRAAFGPKSLFFSVFEDGQFTLYEDKENEKPRNYVVRVGDFLVLSDGSLYIQTSTSSNASNPRMALYYENPQGEEKWTDVLSDAKFITSTDQSLLYVIGMQWEGNNISSYQIQPDGSLANGQPYYHLHTLDNSNSAGAIDMCVDRDGRLYVATNMGIQVCDQAGRVNCIIPLPNNEAATSVVLGGADFDTLFVTSRYEIYKRKVKTKGAPSFLPPVKPAPPRL